MSKYRGGGEASSALWAIAFRTEALARKLEKRIEKLEEERRQMNLYLEVDGKAARTLTGLASEGRKRMRCITVKASLVSEEQKVRAGMKALFR